MHSCTDKRQANAPGPPQLARSPELALRTLATSLPYRVWNGIFAVGDWRAKRGLKTMSPRRDRISEISTREKCPQKPPFCLRAINFGFRKTGWWAHQGCDQ